MISLQELRTAYGNFSVESIINRWKDFAFRENNFTDLPNNNFDESEEFPADNETRENLKDFIEEIEDEKKDRDKLGISFTPVQKNKFSPVDIATTKDWAELRAEALDLHELKNFFVGKRDSQSPQFINLIDNYKKFVEKNLVTPQEIDEDSSTNFVAKLAKVIEERFYTILTSCVRGKQGKGEMPTNYYAEIEERIKKYFERIGLKSENVKSRDDYKSWMEVMKVVEIPAYQAFQDKKIAEVEVQPHYFEYYGDDGEIKKCYIEGKCTVYKFSF